MTGADLTDEACWVCTGGATAGPMCSTHLARTAETVRRESRPAYPYGQAVEEAPMTGVDLTEVTQLAGEDRRAARTLATAEAQRIAAEQARLAADATADRDLRIAAGRQQLATQARAAQHTDRATIAAQRRAERAARRAEGKARGEQRRAWVAARVNYVRGNAPAVYSTGIYGAAVASAVYGQLTAAAQYGLPALVGVAFAAFIEGLALAMALTALSARLDGERAVLPRALTWVCAGIAASINYFGHPGSRLIAVGLAVASVAGITLWEIRSGLRHRRALRDLGLIPDPPARFGWRRWVRFPVDTFGAWSRDVQVRIGEDGARLVAARAAERHRREVAAAARSAAKRCAKQGDAAGAYAALVRLASSRPVDMPARTDASSGRPVRPADAPAGADGRADGRTTQADGRANGRADGRTTQADGRADGPADGRTTQADGRADGPADGRTTQADGRADGPADGRTTQADGRTTQADGRTTQADGRADGRTTQADGRADGPADGRTTQADGRADGPADGRTTQADGRADGPADGRTTQADGRTTQADGRTTQADGRADGRTTQADGRADGPADGRTTQADGRADGPADGRTTQADGRADGPADGRTTQADGRTTQADGRADGRTTQADGPADAGPREGAVDGRTESDAAPLAAIAGRRTVAARSAAPVDGRSPRASAPVVLVRPLPDVSDLLDAGRAVRDELAGGGRTLTRDELVDGLRRAGATVSNARGSALLAALNSEIPAAAAAQL